MADIPSTSITSFSQSSAPTGWTKITTYNNYALRITSGTVGSGGTSGFSSVFTSIIPTGTVSASAAANATALDSTNIPSHTHGYIRKSDGGPNSYTAPGSVILIAKWPSPGTDYTSGPSGAGGNGHNHGMPITLSSTPGFTGSSIPLDVKYLDIIIAQRN